MIKMKSAIVTTTINVPELLDNYMQNVKQNNHDCFFIVIGDKKTPAETKCYCQGLEKKYGIDIEYMDIQDQQKYLEKYPELGEHLVYNSIQRRNIALVRAYEKGAKKIITIDDDNYFIKDDFISDHEVGIEKEMTVLSSSTGWLNVCRYLTEDTGRIFYHRGFPLEKRFQDEEISENKSNVKIVVNAGFWLGDPDIDAMTRLYYLGKPIDVISFEREENFILGKGTWSPFNSQNTALAREVIPAYFLSPYVGRYDDIWAAYVLKRIADHLGGYIAFGNPLVRQNRNPHNYWKDLAKEGMGMILTQRFIGLLNIELKSDNYQDCYKEIVKELKQNVEKIQWAQEEDTYLKKYIEGMEIWAKTFERIN